MEPLFGRLKALLAGRRVKRPAGGALADVAGMVRETTEDEIGCDEAYELLDRYAEMKERGEDPAILLPLVHRHIQRCRDCREELEALLRALSADVK
jgi:hypothetical protein